MYYIDNNIDLDNQKEIRNIKNEKQFKLELFQ